MDLKQAFSATIFCLLLLFCVGCRCRTLEIEATLTATIKVDASPHLAWKMRETLFGIFFEVRK
jgi:alpha-N-arabinofuranosidase